MAKELLSDELWKLIEPILPKPKPRRFQYSGRKPLDRRQVLTGVLFVLRSGIPWEMLPQELGCGSGMSCWRYLREWQEAGVWQQLHEVLLAKLREADRIDWSRAVVDSSSVRAVLGGPRRARIPRIGARRAVSIMSLPMRAASRSPRCSRRPIRMM